jgi:hypothetical protein
MPEKRCHWPVSLLLGDGTPQHAASAVSARNGLCQHCAILKFIAPGCVGIFGSCFCGHKKPSELEPLAEAASGWRPLGRSCAVEMIEKKRTAILTAISPHFVALT